MIKFILAILLLAGGGSADSVLDKRSKRQERFLFYDETGRMVDIFNNPYLQNFLMNAGNLPLFWNFLNPFFNYLRPLALSGASACYMIPVSDQVIQSIYHDPVYQNKLVLPKVDPVIAPNPLCAGKRGSFSSPKSCGAYLNCWDGWAFEQECPAGLLFSNAGYCDYADNVDCQSRSKPPSSSPCSQDFQTFRNKANCNEFFVCVGRQPVMFKCPADLAYSETLGVCDFRDRVNCGNAILADTPIPSGPPSSPPSGIPDAPANPPSGIPSSPPSEIPAAPPAIPPVAPPSDTPSIPSLPNPPSIPANVPSGVPSGIPSIPPSGSQPPFGAPSIPASGIPSSPPFASPSMPFQSFDKGFFYSNSILKRDTWLAAQEAMSRQDAIRQLLSTISKK